MLDPAGHAAFELRPAVAGQPRGHRCCAAPPGPQVRHRNSEPRRPTARQTRM